MAVAGEAASCEDDRVGNTGITCPQLILFAMLKAGKATAAGNFHTGTNIAAGSKLPEFSVIVVSASANQFSTKAP